MPASPVVLTTCLSNSNLPLQATTCRDTPFLLMPAFPGTFRPRTSSAFAACHISPSRRQPLHAYRCLPDLAPPIATVSGHSCACRAPPATTCRIAPIHSKLSQACRSAPCATLPDVDDPGVACHVSAKRYVSNLSSPCQQLPATVFQVGSIRSPPCTACLAHPRAA